MATLPRPFARWTTYEGHGGIDYPHPRNTPVMASGRGTVDWSGYYSARGGYAKFITYDNGLRYGYYHFDDNWGLQKGDRVDYGTVFARVGSLGLLSTGPHLHHEVWQNGTIIKPPAYWNYVDRNSYVGDGSGAGSGSTPFPSEEDELDAVQAKQLADIWHTLTGGIAGTKDQGEIHKHVLNASAKATNADGHARAARTASESLVSDFAAGQAGVRDAGRLLLLLLDAAQEQTVEIDIPVLAAEIAKALPAGGGSGPTAEEIADVVTRVLGEKILGTSTPPKA
jgi:hypothetical protein